MGLRSIIKHELVRVEESLTPRPAQKQKVACQAEPSVRVLELEGRAHALEVTCACGEVVVIELEYPAPTADAQ